MFFDEKLESTLVKPLLGALLWGRLLALPTNIRLDWKYLPGTNTILLLELIGINKLHSKNVLQHCDPCV
jgi:hypothetical protein